MIDESQAYFTTYGDLQEGQEYRVDIECAYWRPRGMGLGDYTPGCCVQALPLPPRAVAVELSEADARTFVERVRAHQASDPGCPCGVGRSCRPGGQRMNLHPDCADDCCWPARLANAGGPTPITVHGSLAAITQGTLRSNEHGITFLWERLPHRDTATNLETAEAFRLEWMATDPIPRRRSSMDPKRYLQSADLKVAIEAAVELLGLTTTAQVASWLDVDEALVDPEWVMRCLVDHAIRMGSTDAEIATASAEWDRPVSRARAATRRQRMALKEVAA